MTYLQAVGDVTCHILPEQVLSPQERINTSPVFCPDPEIEKQMIQAISCAKAQNDSLGGVVQCVAFHLLKGLGEPLYDKLSARLAYAMLGIPAACAFEIGDGFERAKSSGSFQNDSFCIKEQKVAFQTNHAAGILGGISTGEPLLFRVGFKPTSSIGQVQKTVDRQGNEQEFSYPEGSRHDPCVAIRAVSVVKAMCECVLADFCLFKSTNRLPADPKNLNKSTHFQV